MDPEFIQRLLSWLFDQGRLNRLSDRDIARVDEGIGGITDSITGTSADQVLAGTGFDQPFDPNFFSAAGAFQEGLPEGIFDPVGFKPLGQDQFKFDPTELQELGSQLGEDLRGFSGSLDSLVPEAEARFPDFSAFQEERLGGIAEAAREAQRQSRQQIAGQFTDLEQGATEQSRRDFTAQSATAGLSSGVLSDVEAQKADMAEFLGKLGLSVAEIQQLLQTKAADIEANTFGLGEQLEAQNLGVLADVGKFDKAMQTDIDRFNKTFGADLASRGAQFTAEDQGKQFNAWLAQALARLGAGESAAGRDASGSAHIAQLLAGISEPFLSFSQSVTNPLLAGSPEEFEQKQGGQAFGFGYTCVSGSSLIVTPSGVRQLRKIRIGDYVLAAGGHIVKVVAKDYGWIPEGKQPRQIILLTDDGSWLSVTDDHSIGGRRAGEWKVGEMIPTVRGPSRIASATDVPYTVSGDLMLEGNLDYFANGFIVNSMIGKIGLERWNRIIAA